MTSYNVDRGLGFDDLIQGSVASSVSDEQNDNSNRTRGMVGGHVDLDSTLMTLIVRIYYVFLIKCRFHWIVTIRKCVLSAL